MVNKMNKGKIIKITAGILSVLATLLVIVGVTHHGSSKTYAAHGTFIPTSEAMSMFGGVTERAYCVGTTPVPGTQVVVKDPSGKVLGVSNLGSWSDQNNTINGIVLYSCAMPFTINNLPSESVYGFSVNGVSGVTWVSPTELGNVSLYATSPQ